MSKKVRIILNVVLGLVLVGCIVGLVFLTIHCWELDHNMFLKEYSAQMDKFGYYKGDIHLFDQHLEEVRYIWCLIGTVLGWGCAISLLLGNIISGLADNFNVFKY